ncbi:hypothetical protein E2562_007936 [Oryza meyeriana var. granulata]|uniref:Uncharacterized protein n=1 Tax=Oryza meyeriana var. granulata TaxID=110450 RepID=A0A6G1DEW0_9ORYZ|nr:hypothetical protein E2562_007936 [Oryza meyeriana var. granulata]
MVVWNESDDMQISQEEVLPLSAQFQEHSDVGLVSLNMTSPPLQIRRRSPPLPLQTGHHYPATYEGTAITDWAIAAD